jgi:hypothetical protein
MREVNTYLRNDTALHRRITNVVVGTNAPKKGGNNQSRQIETAKQCFVVYCANAFDVLIVMYRLSK